MATAEPPVSISETEQRWLSGGIVSGVRGDGRSAADVRRIGVSTGVLPSSSGSSEARMAGAHAMVGVRVELEPPLPSYPDRGTVTVTVEISPCAGPQWYGRSGEERAAEVAAALSSSLGGVSGASSDNGQLPPAIDLRSLCVARGAAAWHLRVHCLLLSLDGTSATLTAASAAVAAALADVRIPATNVIGGGESDVEGDDEAAPPEVEVEDDLSKATALDASRVPVFATVALASTSGSSSNSISPLSTSVVGLAADPDAEEEAASRASVSAAFDAGGLLRASFFSFGGGRASGSGTGGGGMSAAQVSAALALARSVGGRLAGEVAGVARESVAATA